MNSTIFGRISRDAELSQTTGGTSVAKFGVALNVYKKGGSDVTWINAAVFGAQADSLAQWLTKGTSVALSGDLVLREYESRDNGRKTSLDFNVQSVALLGGGQQEVLQAVRPAAKAATVPARPPRATIPNDDDIPF